MSPAGGRIRLCKRNLDLIAFELPGAALRHALPLALLFFVSLPAAQALSQSVPLPDAPSFQMDPGVVGESSSVVAEAAPYSLYPPGYEPQQGQDAAARAAQQADPPRGTNRAGDYDANGIYIPLEVRQPKRILGFMPNFRSVSSGSAPPPPGWRYNFKVATRQSFDYSSFIFLGITSLSAEGLNSHPALGKGVKGLYEYTWRGFLDKTDGTYLQAWLLPSLLHEDTRYYARGHGRIVTRALYVISRQAVTRTYGGRQTPNIAGLGGKVLTQYISRNYYPAGTSDFSVLATKFGYSAMRDIAFTSIREFYPTIAAHYIRKHHEKVARLASATP